MCYNKFVEDLNEIVQYLVDISNKCVTIDSFVDGQESQQLRLSGFYNRALDIKPSLRGFKLSQLKHKGVPETVVRGDFP